MFVAKSLGFERGKVKIVKRMSLYAEKFLQSRSQKIRIAVEKLLSRRSNMRPGGGMADTHDSKSCAARHESSTLSPGTT